MARRRLELRNMEAIVKDAENLEAGGYQPVGNWDLGQICDHLATSVHGSTRGFPLKAPWIVRRFLGPYFFRKMRRLRRMKANVPLPEKFKPKPGTDATKSIARLRDAIDEFGKHAGPWPDHPILGRMGRDEWLDFHLIHASHHLSFLIPTDKT
ncbi:MAG: DUF1569 domain-containing protein [Planctomycetota bacterium]